MKVKIVYSDSCPHCQELKRALKEQNGIPDKDIEMVDAMSDEGQIVSLAYDIEMIPTAVNDNGVCEITYVDGRVDIICPELENEHN